MNKSLFVIPIIAVICISGLVIAEHSDGSDTVENTWTSGSCICTLNTDTGVLVIKGNGQMADYSSSGAQPWAQQRGDIRTIVVESGVTSIGARCFQSCGSLTSIKFADTVLSIGDSAFNSCSALTIIDLPVSITTIGAYAFRDCSAVTAILYKALTWKITSIGATAFSLGTATKSVSASVYSPFNVADGKLDAYKGAYTTLRYTLPLAWISGDCRCNLYVVTGEFRISGNGAMADYAEGQPWFDSQQGIGTVIAEDGVTHIGGLSFYYCSSLTTAYLPDTVTSIGDSAFMFTVLDNIDLPDGLTSIGHGAFNSTSLTSIVIPDTVTSIGDGAFESSDLETIEFKATAWNITIGADAFSLAVPTCTVYSPNNIADGRLDSYQGTTTMVYHDASLLEWTSGDCTCTLDTDTGVFTVSGTGAMADYQNADDQPWKSARQSITSVAVQSGVTYIGHMAFAVCQSLASATISEGVASIGASAFSTCQSLASVTIPNSVTSIGASAFEVCTSLASVTIPNSVTSIASYAFMRCISLSSITIPSSVTTIDTSAFKECSSLASITIPSSVTTIRATAFQGCTSLTSITFLTATWNITSIGSNAFDLGTQAVPVTAVVSSPNNVADGQLDSYKGSYTTLTYSPIQSWTSGACTVTMDDNGVVSISGNGAMANYGTASARPWNQSAQNMVSIVVENGVTAIGNYTFTDCSSLTSVEMAGTVQSVGQYAFKGCSALTSIEYGDGVQSIGHYSCQDCTALESITIPASVTNIYAGAFQGCVQVENILFESETWNTTLSASSFSLGTASSPATAVVSSYDNVADGKLDSYKGSYTTLTYQAYKQYIEVTIQPNDATYGTVSISQVVLPLEGGTISIDNNRINIGGTWVTATPAQATQYYSYSFDSWSGVPEGGTITEDTTITAVFTRSEVLYTVTFAVNNPEYGSVSPASVSVPYGTQIRTSSSSPSTLTIGSNTITATRSPWTEGAKYFFDNWSGIPSPASVTGDITITANFHKEAVQCTVSFNTTPLGFGTVSQSSVTVDYGTAITVDGNTLTIGSATVTATPIPSDYQWTYSFLRWDDVPDTVTGNTSITAVFSRVQTPYTVTIEVNNAEYGSVTENTLSVPYNAPVRVQDDKIYFDTLSVTADPADPTAQYEYAFESWSGVPESGKITEAVTITANFIRSVREYTVSFDVNEPTYGTVAPTSVIVPYGTEWTSDGNILTISGTAVTATPKPSTPLWDYHFDSWTQPTGSVNEDTTITANFTRDGADFNVTYNGNGGTPQEQTEIVEYGDYADLSGHTCTREGFTFVGWNTKATASTALTEYVVKADTVLYAIWSLELDTEEYVTDPDHHVTEIIEGPTLVGDILKMVPIFVALQLISSIQAMFVYNSRRDD